MKSKSIVLFLAEKDFDEQEFLVIKSYLIKNAFNIFIASDSFGVCLGSDGMKVKNEIQLTNLNAANFAGIILIGGKGIINYFNNQKLHSIVNKFSESKKVIGAICAAPIILARAGILKEKTVTCNINYKKELEREGAIYGGSEVSQTKNIITAQLPINSPEFIEKFIQALKLVK